MIVCSGLNFVFISYLFLIFLYHHKCRGSTVTSLFWLCEVYIFDSLFPSILSTGPKFNSEISGFV